MKCTMIIGLLFCFFGTMLCAMHIEEEHAPLFVQCTLDPQDHKKFILNFITPQDNPKLCARMLEQGESSLGVCIAIHIDALALLEKNRSVEDLMNLLLNNLK